MARLGLPLAPRGDVVGAHCGREPSGFRRLHARQEDTRRQLLVRGVEPERHHGNAEPGSVGPCQRRSSTSRSPRQPSLLPATSPIARGSYPTARGPNLAAPPSARHDQHALGVPSETGGYRSRVDEDQELQMGGPQATLAERDQRTTRTIRPSRRGDRAYGQPRALLRRLHRCRAGLARTGPSDWFLGHVADCRLGGHVGRHRDVGCSAREGAATKRPGDPAQA